MKLHMIILFSVLAIFCNGCYISKLKQLEKSYTQIRKEYLKENNKLLSSKETLKKIQDSVKLVSSQTDYFIGQFIINNKISDSLSSIIKENLGEYWTNQNKVAANTAKDIKVLSTNEKQIYMYLNLARSYPSIFAELYLNPFLSGYYLKDIYEQKSSVDTSSLWYQSYYANSLYLRMKKMSPAPAIDFDEKCWESAKCHSITVGKLGLVTHERQKGCEAHFGGECCFYGPTDSRYIIVELLVDAGVQSLGHRNICLNSYYSVAGISTQKHIGYGFNTTLDFY